MPEVDLDRPSLHLTASRGWINDPLSLTWHDGEYHVFYQYVPDSLTWAASCHWGHATSSDLVHWQERPVALAPGEGDDGIWSGSLATGDDGETRLFYTAVTQPDVGLGRVRIARPSGESWDSWTKGDVVAAPPADEAVTVYRDPFVFRDGEGWRMLVGAGFDDGTAAALSYSSPDLDSWRYDGVAASRSGDLRDPVWTGSLWECPQIFHVDGSDVLITSVWKDDVLYYAAYGVGVWADGRFEARAWGRLTFGDSYYAPSFFRDRDGRPGLVFWLREVRDRAETTWTGAMSVPHVLSLDGDVLVARAHPAVGSGARSVVVGAGGGGTGGAGGDGARSVALEVGPVQVTWFAGSGAVLSLAGRDGEAVRLTAGVDGLRVEVHANGWADDVPLAGGPVEVLIDGPVVEISTGRGLFATPVPLLTAVTVL